VIVLHLASRVVHNCFTEKQWETHCAFTVQSSCIFHTLNSWQEACDATARLNLIVLVATAFKLLLLVKFTVRP
jgi:hypothetical protein